MKREKLFSFFRADFDGIDSETLLQIKNTYYHENFIKLRLSAFLVLLCQIIFIVRDFAAGFFLLNRLNYINLVFQVTMSIASLCVLIFIMFNHAEWTKSRARRLIYNGYLLILVLSVCAFIFTDMYVRHSAFGINICFLFVPISMPYFDMLRQALLFFLVALFSAIVYLFCFQEDPLGVIGVILMPFLLYVTSCFLRTYFIRILKYRVQTKALTDELMYRNKTDFLTDISNRLCLYDDYQTAKANGQSVGIILYDIDDFKIYNDTFSHLAGDECLKKTSHAVKAFVGTHNGKAYRYGGEEFIVMFFGIDEQTFAALPSQVNAIIYALQLPQAKTATFPYVSASSGATFSSDPTESMERVLLRIDRAMYQAKNNGKNCHVLV